MFDFDDSNGQAIITRFTDKSEIGKIYKMEIGKKIFGNKEVSYSKEYPQRCVFTLKIEDGPEPVKLNHAHVLMGA